MSKIHKFSLEAPNYGRSISDDAWDTVDPAYIVLWKSAVTVLGRYETALSDATASAKFHWKPILARHQKHYSALRRLDRNQRTKSKYMFEGVKFSRKPGRVSIEAQEVLGDAWTTKAVVASMLHDCFLILNIAAPGACDFGRAVLTGDSLPKHLQSTDISLSNIHFESAPSSFWTKVGLP